MNLTLQELDHILESLDNMSTSIMTRSKSESDDYEKLVTKLRVYRHRLTRP